jgi:hypothetical protein
MLQRWQQHSIYFVGVEAEHGRGFVHFFRRMGVIVSASIGRTRSAEHVMDFLNTHAIATTFAEYKQD